MAFANPLLIAAIPRALAFGTKCFKNWQKMRKD